MLVVDSMDGIHDLVLNVYVRCATVDAYFVLEIEVMSSMVVARESNALWTWLFCLQNMSLCQRFVGLSQELFQLLVFISRVIISLFAHHVNMCMYYGTIADLTSLGFNAKRI
eukprot:906916_1